MIDFCCAGNVNFLNRSLPETFFFKETHREAGLEPWSTLLGTRKGALGHTCLARRLNIDRRRDIVVRCLLWEIACFGVGVKAFF